MKKSSKEFESFRNLKRIIHLAYLNLIIMLKRKVIRVVLDTLRKLKGTYVSQNERIRLLAEEVGEIDGQEYWIVMNPMWKDKTPEETAKFPSFVKEMYGDKPYYNGYAVFKKRPVKEKGYDGIVTYVPVHGGITYAQQDRKIGMVYGFDTSHYDSARSPRWDKVWIKEEIAKMIIGLKQARLVEKQYLKAKDKNRIPFIERVRGKEEIGNPNFGEMMNMLRGKL